MGQYWRAVFLNCDGDVLFAMQPRFRKLMEHAYLDDPFMEQVERLIIRGGLFYKICLVWAGDYSESNL